MNREKELECVIFDLTKECQELRTRLMQSQLGHRESESIIKKQTAYISELHFEYNRKTNAIIRRFAKEIETLQSLIPHDGDGSCDICGFTPASKAMLCNDCSGKII